MLKRCVLLLLYLLLFSSATTAQERGESEAREFYHIEEGAAVRGRVEEVKLPILNAEFYSFTVCGSDTYRIKDADGGYLIFTLHSFDRRRQLRPITIDNLLGTKPDFAHELTADGEEERLLVKLLQGWRDTTFTAKRLRTFERFSRLKGEAAATRALDSLSKGDSDLFSMWILIWSLEERQKLLAADTAARRD